MDKKYLFVTLFLVVLVVVGGYFVSQIPSDSANIDTTDTLGAETSGVDMNEKLEIQDEIVGTGAEAISGKTITVNYSGTLTDGTKFDSSYDRNEPFTFVLGAGEVIQGWAQGFAGMKIGGKRKLTIPPSLGYGSNDMGVIPPNSTLIFEVELLKVE
jgi:FKBP-type peptidyl-prolyl cis-trans isomerase